MVDPPPAVDIRRAKRAKFELELMEEFDTSTADFIMAFVPVPAGMALGFAIGELAHPELLVTNGDDPRFEESAAFTGMMIGAASGVVVTALYFVLRKSTKQKVREHMRRVDRRSREREVSDYKPDAVTFQTAGVSLLNKGKGFIAGATFTFN